jgi:hypothetical protein
MAAGYLVLTVLNPSIYSETFYDHDFHRRNESIKINRRYMLILIVQLMYLNLLYKVMLINCNNDGHWTPSTL